jgi:subtilase family serine protease
VSIYEVALFVCSQASRFDRFLSGFLHGLATWGLGSTPFSTQATGSAPSSLITHSIDESRLTVLRGNTHPLARPQFDLGTAPATLPMQRMLLVLKRSAAQELSLRTLLDNQQDKASPNYHKWLTPEEYGKQFGPTDADIQTITSWLQSHGFQVGTTKGRTVLEFSGSASQVQAAFHTSIHKYVVNEEQHWANSSDPSIPTALTPAVAGVLTLHNFLKKPQIRISKQQVAAKVTPGKRPEITFTNGSHGFTASGVLATSSSTITVATSATTTGALRTPKSNYLAYWLAAGGFGFISIVIGGARRRYALLLLVALLAMIMILPACGGGGGGSTAPPAQTPGTPTGTYNVTVTATSGSVTSTTGFTLVVN